MGPGAEGFVSAYKYDIAPSTDGRPYFFNTFRWRLVPELVALRGAGGLGLLGLGYPILAATFVQVAVLTLILVPLPLVVRRRAGLAAYVAVPKARVLAYFLALGFAFLFIEMVYIQKLKVHPCSLAIPPSHGPEFLAPSWFPPASAL